VFGENHPLSRSLTPEELAVISVDDLREHHARVYVPSGLQIYLSGRISPSIEDKLNDVFGCVAVDKPAQGLNIIPFEQSLGKSRIIQRHGALQSALKISIPTINRDDEDYLDLRLAVAALGGYFGSRLMTNIREDKGYTYGISAALMGYREGA
jgi:predicted Zn-dependent peptidase